MDLIKLKQFISSHALTKKLAEPLLNSYVRLRYVKSRSYTKDHEDRAVLGLLKKRFGLAPSEVRYFDIGANHYLRGSNSYLAYRCGATGVLVEADPMLCEQLRKHRPKDTVLNSAITDQAGSGDLTFYVCSLATRSTLDPVQAERLKRHGFTIEREIAVPALSFEEIVEKYGFTPDFLSIDVEGYDLRVLKSIDLEKYPVKVILAETDAGMDEYMKECGYRRIRQYSSNTLFCRKQSKTADGGNP